ncbi:hypothetical protein [Sediminicurvatus halobius]|uniref:hypothetical protein n=1 Tax=Sediminicurvatus halobius TaxID=2182432 RepID=UPI0011B290F4|nr:hypothetical protein [Spiribacter halobius]UEX79745.1 hypothetical protein LMH63_08895 [Spiribacter halobius]
MSNRDINSCLCRIWETVWLADTFAKFDENKLHALLGEGHAGNVIEAMRRELERRALDAMDAMDCVEEQIGHVPDFHAFLKSRGTEEAKKHEHD